MQLALITTNTESLAQRGALHHSTRPQRETGQKNPASTGGSASRKFLFADELSCQAVNLPLSNHSLTNLFIVE
jgi:hypothetical protein